jgi:hypothetical protein
VLAVERTLMARWPHRFANSPDVWCVDDAAYIHDPLFNPHPNCRYCYAGSDIRPTGANSDLGTAA